MSDYATASSDPKTLIYDIISTPHLPWDWAAVSARADVTAEVVGATPWLPWDRLTLMRRGVIEEVEQVVEDEDAK